MKFSKALCVFMMAATASQTAFAGKLRVSECVSNRNPFVQDSCQALAAQSNNNCTVSLNGDLVSVEASELGVLTGRSNLSANLGDMIQTGRHTLNFGGLNRGMAVTRSRSLVQVEVYLNHDRSGQTYTRLICK